jgi:hypothetical protein
VTHEMANVNQSDGADCEACSEADTKTGMCAFHLGVEVGYRFASTRVIEALEACE